MAIFCLPYCRCCNQSVVRTFTGMSLHALAIPALVTPLVLAVAMLAQRVGGAAAAGLVASLPLQAAVGALGVASGSGDRAVAQFAIAAATFLPAQIAYGLAFTLGMRLGGFRPALGAGVAAYSAAVVAIGEVPSRVSIVVGVVAVALAQRFVASPSSASSEPAAARNDVVVVALGTLGVLAVVVLVQVAGPAAGAFMAALPVVTPLLAFFLARAHGREAGSATMAGMVRGLPMSLAFVASLAFLSEALGTTIAVAVGLSLSLGVAGALWQRSKPRVAAGRVHGAGVVA